MKSKPLPRPNVRELLALNLKRLRAVRGWSQEVLALEAGLDRTFVAHVERMKRNISLDNIEKLAAALSEPFAGLFMIAAPKSDPMRNKRSNSVKPRRTVRRISRRRASPSA